MLTSLVLLLLLQSYLSVNAYQSQRESFRQDLDTILHRAIEREFAARQDTMIQFFLRDLFNPQITQIDLQQSEAGELIFHLKQPGDSAIYTSISFADTPTKKAVWTDTLRAFFEQMMTKQLRSQLVKDVVMYWTDTLGTRMVNFRDNLPVDTMLFHRAISRELDARRLRSDFHLLLLTHPSDTLNKQQMQVVSQRKLPYYTDNQPVYAVLTLTDPGLDILRRSLWTIFGSLSVIAVTVAGFFVLFSTILRQKELEEIKDDFFDNVTHELQTPITALQMVTESLEKLGNNPDSQRRQQYLQIAQQELHRLRTLVDRILERSWQQMPPDKPIALTQFVHEHLDRFCESAHKPVRIERSIDKNLSVRATPHQMAVILDNLLQNALKYSDPQGVSISVVLKRCTHWVVLQVLDDGWGIPAEDQANIFDKFSRSVHADRNYAVKGLGIGLYHVRQCVEALGGLIRFAPNTPCGSTFSIQFPAYEPDFTD